MVQINTSKSEGFENRAWQQQAISNYNRDIRRKTVKNLLGFSVAQGGRCRDRNSKRIRCRMDPVSWLSRARGPGQARVYRRVRGDDRFSRFPSASELRTLACP